MATKKQSLTVPVVDKPKQDCHCGCTPCDGTCCRLDCIVQPHFFCGQLLTDADLSALLKWARDRFGLSRYRHGWGVVCGLDVRGKYGSPTTVIVTPGYAVDCCGNDVVVCEDAPLDLKKYCRDDVEGCADLRAENDNEVELGDRLRAIDIYLRYDEQSADPTTAMGRGSCKQVSECEYSRTKETYRLVAECGVAGTDPVKARAMKWHEEYEKCLDVLKNFRGQFQGGGLPEDVRQWLLRWLDDHPEYGLSYLRKKLRDAPKAFFQPEANLVNVLFALVQVCRNAYLNCDCFGCDEDVRLPLARVWMLPEDRRTDQECRIVAIDAYPPYRRPIQPECWPAPLGYVNVGRFIWHRWDEVCQAVDDLGLNIERTPFVLPATLGDLEKSLSCDLFVRCDERRAAYVLDVQIPGLNVNIFGERVIGFCTAAPGPGPEEPGPGPTGPGPTQPEPTGPGPGPGPEEPPKVVECPKITIDHQAVVFTGQKPTFTAVVTPSVPNLVFKWEVFDGTILSGQDTPSIVVDPFKDIGVVAARVEIGGLDPKCPNEDKASTEIRAPQPIDERREDDFTVIPQIGDNRASVLKNAGIKSFRDLRDTPPETLRKLFGADIGVTGDLINEWLQVAKKRAG